MTCYRDRVDYRRLNCRVHDSLPLLYLIVDGCFRPRAVRRVVITSVLLKIRRESTWSLGEISTTQSDLSLIATSTDARQKTLSSVK